MGKNVDSGGVKMLDKSCLCDQIQIVCTLELEINRMSFFFPQIIL